MVNSFELEYTSLKYKYYSSRARQDFWTVVIQYCTTQNFLYQQPCILHSLQYILANVLKYLLL